MYYLANCNMHYLEAEPSYSRDVRTGRPSTGAPGASEASATTSYGASALDIQSSIRGIRSCWKQRLATDEASALDI